MNEIESNILHRDKAYLTHRISSQLDESEEFYKQQREKSHSLYCRSSECENVTLDQFELISVIGRGNFGKVSKFE